MTIFLLKYSCSYGIFVPYTNILTNILTNICVYIFVPYTNILTNICVYNFVPYTNICVYTFHFTKCPFIVQYINHQCGCSVISDCIGHGSSIFYYADHKLVLALIVCLLNKLGCHVAFHFRL